jgi:hypothetical protein
MTQDFRCAKGTFRVFEENFMFREYMKNLINMGKMGLPSFTIDENINKETKTK